MTDSALELSVVMPAYNEEQTIGRAIDEVIAYVAPVVTGLDIVIVDDGSRDSTGAIVAARANDDCRIRYIRQANAGHGPALQAGLAAARGEAVLLLDSDCQVDLSDFGDHWQAFQSHPAVLGFRKPRFDGWHRAAISALMKALIQLLFRAAPIDAGTPFKLVRIKHWHDIVGLIQPADPVPAVLLATYLVNDVEGVAERRVVHRPRKGTSSSLRPLRLARLCLTATNSIVKFRSRYSAQPDSRAIAADKWSGAGAGCVNADDDA